MKDTLENKLYVGMLRTFMDAVNWKLEFRVDSYKSTNETVCIHARTASGDTIGIWADPNKENVVGVYVIGPWDSHSRFGFALKKDGVEIGFHGRANLIPSAWVPDVVELLIRWRELALKMTGSSRRL